MLIKSGDKSNAIAVRSGIWYSVSNFVQASMSLIATPIFSRILEQGVFGAFQNYIAWISVIRMFLTLNPVNSLVSAKIDYKDKWDQFISSIFFLGGFSSLFFAGIFYFVHDTIYKYFSIDFFYVVLSVVFLFFLHVIELYRVNEAYLFRYFNVVKINIFLSVSELILSIAFILNASDKLYARILGYSIPTCCLGMVLSLGFIYRERSVDFSCWRYAILICLPVIPHSLSLTLLNSMDKIMITNICGLEYTALYSLAYTCGRAGTVLSSSMNSAYVPWLTERIIEEDYLTIRRKSYLYISFFAFIVIGIILLAPELLYVLGGTAYIEAIYVLPPVIMGCFAQFLYTMFVNIEQINKKTSQMAIASVSAAVINYVLNLIFIPQYGYLAAAYTTFFGYLWLLFVHMYIVKRIGYDFVYNYKFIVSLLGVISIIAFLINFLYSFYDFRLLTVLIYFILLLVLYLKRDLVKQYPFLKWFEK